MRVLAGPRGAADRRLSEEVKVLLVRRQLPASALADVLGKSQQIVSSRLNGRTKWTVEDLMRLAVFFDVGVDDLLPLQGLPHVDSNHEPAG